MPCLAYTMPFLNLVSVVFGTAIPTSLYILETVFYTSLFYVCSGCQQCSYVHTHFAMNKITQTFCWFLSTPSTLH